MTRMRRFCRIVGHNADGYESHREGDDAVSRTWCTRCGETMRRERETVVDHNPDLRDMIREAWGEYEVS